MLVGDLNFLAYDHSKQIDILSTFISDATKRTEKQISLIINHKLGKVNHNLNRIKECFQYFIEFRLHAHFSKERAVLNENAS